MSELALLRQQAVLYHREGRFPEAEHAYRQLLQREPSSSVASNLGALLRSQGRLDEAQAHYRWALSAWPDDPQLLANACNLLRDVGKVEATLPLLERGIEQSPQHFGLRQGLALSLHQLGRIDEALALLQSLLVEQPDSPSLRLELGACMAKRGQLVNALKQFEQVHQLEPANVTALANRIAMLSDLGRHQEALQLLEQAPGRCREVRLIGAEAALRYAINDVETALELHQQLTQLEPAVADHWLNLAACQKQLRQMVAPLHSLQQGLKLAPERLDLQLSLGTLLVEHGRYKDGLQLLKGALDHPDAKDRAHSLYQFAAAGNRIVPAAELQRHMSRWEQERALKPSEMWSDRIRDSDLNRPLRVGYLSPDYCNHPVGRFMEPIFSMHDRTKVEVIGLSCGRHHDAFHQHLQQLCDSWHDIRYGDDLHVARFLADLRLDVLVDLGGHTADQRIRLLTARPAPIQLSYLGYPASTFLNCIDGWIGDKVVFGSQQELEKGPREQLLRLSRCYLAYHPQPDTPEPDRTAPDDRFRFGSFNHSRKLSDRCLDLFAAVLREVPSSLLVLKSTTFVEVHERHRIARRMAERGIGPERLELLEWVFGNHNHLALYGRMDVALDTLPYSGTTTTCEALWMGVPVLTLLGHMMVERQSAAVLAGAGLEAAIASSEKELLQSARRMAARGPRSSHDRLALRRHVAASQLADSAGLVHELEHVYRQLWVQRPTRWRL
ncbi:MAG: tetratricopeptide repeat protein [Vulcanococcus sp.]|uniref:O-linked N-acetylglucosamine transferase, SPINDLY family protein n=1 Tax=Vulcanococcus sp. TaxID=2856995 RepID=UPI0025CF31B9|nr:glycosyltransferase family 41 protein [Vulcanococcus sp.]MBW0181060.1 tetratricopeptide repeat protein [Vulcanococcus sp.]